MDKETIELKELFQEWLAAGHTKEEIIGKCMIALGLKEAMR
jgi:hypothetical protein